MVRINGIRFLKWSLLQVRGGVADYDGVDYWDSRYKGRANQVFQWLQKESDIEAHLSSFITHFGIHNEMSRVVELGFGSSDIAYKVLYKSTMYGPEFRGINENGTADHGPEFGGIYENETADHANGTATVPRSVVTCDYSTVAHQQQIERRDYTPGKFPGLYYVAADIYDFLQILSNHVNENSEVNGAIVTDSRLKAGHWIVDSRPVDLVFDSSVHDTLIIQGREQVKKGMRFLFDSMNPNHGAWLSVSYNSPENRLDVYQAQPWTKVIVCRPLTLGTNHLYWLLRGEMWTNIELKSDQQLGSYTCNDSSYYEPDTKSESKDEL